MTKLGAKLCVIAFRDWTLSVIVKGRLNIKFSEKSSFCINLAETRVVKSEDFFAKTSSEHLKSEEILIPTTTTKYQSIENNKKQPTSSNMIEKNSTKFEVSKYDLKCEKNNRKNRAILKLLSQKIDGTQE